MDFRITARVYYTVTLREAYSAAFESRHVDFNFQKKLKSQRMSLSLLLLFFVRVLL